MVPLMHQVVTLGTVIMLVSLVYDTYRQPSASPEPDAEDSDVRKRSDACIYRFICELHSTDDILKYGGTGLTFLKFFKSNPVLERPFSGSYNYYFAAHMGHLMRGGSGGGCPFLFPSCPLRGEQVAKVLSSVESLRTF